MRILLLHSDFIKFQAEKQAIKDAEKIEKAEHEVQECLVVLTSVEKRDENNPDAVIKRYAKEVDDVAKQVKADKIVIYPYVHLTTDPSSPQAALQILKSCEEELNKSYKVTRSPFGWYKSFTLACKGHPLAELSREFGPEETKEDESQALKSEKKLVSSWFILDTEGKLHDIGKFNFKGHDNLRKFAFYEKDKDRTMTQEPAHVPLMKKLEIADYEPGSDSGNMRYYPKGRLIKSLLETYITEKVIDYGGVEVETPIMYDMAHPTLSKYLQRFPARQYKIESDKRNFFLRFAACFGQFLIAHDATLSYKDLPLKLYELTRYSFRREQRGELTGLRRLRAFTMPDCHALVTGLNQAISEFKLRNKLCFDVLENVGIKKEDVELAVRVTKEFYESNKDIVLGLVKAIGKPALVEMWDERTFYFILKYELNFVDSLDKASALSTDQIDVENGERYDIKFTDKDGQRKHPLILHCSPSGAIERNIYALLEKAAMQQKQGKTPSFPLWLSPTQVRIIPVTSEFTAFAGQFVDEIAKENIRVDIDDRELHVGKKIREAEMEWCSFILVIGEKEKNLQKLPIRVRGNKDLVEMALKDLIAEIKEKTAGMPFKRLSLPKELSRRPVFVG
ncbi:threonine--tRNA ligase [Candidatus Woesearchaeota archaeon]|nr:threonine--tRNA ligase [Candidatus Woesearchaeota archaeon]